LTSWATCVVTSHVIAALLLLPLALTSASSSC
jgi:hypothetical protein